MYHIFFIYSSVDGRLGCFHVLAIVNSAAVNIGVHVSFQIMVFSGYMPRRGIDVSLKIVTIWQILFLYWFVYMYWFVYISGKDPKCIYELSDISGAVSLTESRLHSLCSGKLFILNPVILSVFQSYFQSVPHSKIH